jgi:hypothetical protein
VLRQPRRELGAAQLRRRRLVLGAQGPDQVIDQERQVVQALAERWQPHLDRGSEAYASAQRILDEAEAARSGISRVPTSCARDSARSRPSTRRRSCRASPPPSTCSECIETDRGRSEAG